MKALDHNVQSVAFVKVIPKIVKDGLNLNLADRIMTVTAGEIGNWRRADGHKSFLKFVLVQNSCFSV